MRLVILLSFIAVLAGPLLGASADIVTVRYRGEVVSESFTVGNTSVLSIGTLVFGSFSYETSTNVTIIDSGRSRYSNALLAHDITIEGTIFSLSQPADVSIDNNSISNFDAFRTSNTDFQEQEFISGMTITDSSISFIDSTQTAFFTTALPAQIDFNDFTHVGGPMGFENTSHTAATIYTLGNVTAVPEPSSSILLGSCLFILVSQRGKKRGS